MSPLNVPFSRLVLLAAALFTAGLTGCDKPAAPAAARAEQTPPAPAPAAPPSGVIFSSFGPTNSCNPTNCWGINAHAHAEWFVAKTSGRLSELTLAISPGSGPCEIFLARDTNHFPGAVLETFTVASHAFQPKLAMPLVLHSTNQPALEGGVKYWVCARAAKPGWTWHFNDQKICRNTAREADGGKWLSAGEYCYVGAYSVTLGPAPEPPAPASPPR
jgi:hypothetical protein